MQFLISLLPSLKTPSRPPTPPSPRPSYCLNAEKQQRDTIKQIYYLLYQSIYLIYF